MKPILDKKIFSLIKKSSEVNNKPLIEAKVSPAELDQARDLIFSIKNFI